MRRLPFRFLVITVILTASCSKNDEAEILSYNISRQEAEVDIRNSNKSVTVTFPENFTAAGNLVADFIISDGASATVDGIYQLSGITANDFRSPFVYSVISENRKNSVDWEIRSFNNNYTNQYGLGGFLSVSRSNNRYYDWYIDQAYTGTHSAVNCGPASVTMAARWSDFSFSKTAQDARNAYRSDGGWWFTSDISNYLSDNSIPGYIVMLASSESETTAILMSHLDNGRIYILCVDMYYVRKEKNTSFRVDRFYEAGAEGWGHFIVVKGYRKVDGKVYFEVYDPFSYDVSYTNGALKGRDRYYRSEDIFMATSKWWNYAIVVTENTKGVTLPEGLDPAMVPHQKGR